MSKELRLGKLPFQPDDRDVKFAAFAATVTIPPVPKGKFGHGYAFKDWHMLGNGPDDSVAPGFQGAGDCVFAGAGHETMLTYKLGPHQGHVLQITGKEAIADYSAVTGYVIGDDSTDQGTEVREALKYRHKTGVLDADGNRHQIGGYVSINPKDWTELWQAVYCFTAVGIGFEFPDSAMTQFDAGQRWDVVDGAQIEGGHYVPIVGRASVTHGACVTWGRRQGFTRDFYEAYNDEAWAIVFPEELRNGKNERGLDLAGLNAILAALT